MATKAARAAAAVDPIRVAIGTLIMNFGVGLKWLAVAIPGSWAAVRMVESLSGENTNVTADIKIAAAVSVTLGVGNVVQARRERRFKASLIRQRTRITTLESTLRAHKIPVPPAPEEREPWTS
jgi:uncharacterized protein YaiI (UPF0178 family)